MRKYVKRVLRHGSNIIEKDRRRHMPQGGIQDKREDFEWIERGKDLAEINVLVRAWKHMLPSEFLTRITHILKRYSNRSLSSNDAKYTYKKGQI